jgi:DNA-binding NarL/FixJ family response regulator
LPPAQPGEVAFAAVIPEELLMPARSQTLSVHVTRKEAEILKLLTRGFSNAEIGVAMKITTGTVKHHISQAAAKLDLHSRILLARNWGYPLFRLGAGRK